MVVVTGPSAIARAGKAATAPEGLEQVRDQAILY